MSKIKVNNIESLAASGTITSNSNLDFQNSYSLINVSGVTAQNVTVLGTLTSAGFAPSGDLTSNGNFQVGTTSVFNIDSSTGDTGVSGTLGVVGAVNFASTANIGGNTTVSGTTVSLGDLSVGSGPAKMTVAAANGNTVVGGTLDVKGNISNSTGDVTIDNVLTVTGITKVTDATASLSTATGALQVSGGVGVAGNVHVGGDLSVDGSTGNFAVNTDKVVIAKSSGDTTIAGTLNTSSNRFSVDSSGNISTSGTLNAGGVNFRVDSSGNTTVSGTLTVGGNSSLKNTNVDGTLTTKDITSVNEYIRAEASESISTGRFVRISGTTVDELPKVGMVSTGSHTPLAYYDGAVNLSTGDKASFIKRGIVDATGFTSTSIGEKIYCSDGGILTLTSTDFLVGFTVEAITNPKVYLNIGGSGGGGGTPTVVTSSVFQQKISSGTGILGGTAITLSGAPIANSAIVFVGGVIQDPTVYSITGDQLEFDPGNDIPANIDIVVYGFIDNLVVTTPVDNYVSIIDKTIDNNDSALLGETESGSYRFFVRSDPRICGDINIKYINNTTAPDVRIDTNSSQVSDVLGNSGFLNFYIDGSNKINIENKLGSNDVIRLYKFKTT